MNAVLLFIQISDSEYMENAQAGHSWATWRADLQTLAPTLFK